MKDEGLIYVPPLNDEHIRSIGIALGLSVALNTLRETKAMDAFGKLPGYNTGIALIEGIEARQRAEVAGANFRAAAKAGYDVQTHMVGLIGPGKIFVKPMDLEELAEFGADGGK